MARCTAYLQIEPTFRRWVDQSGRHGVASVTAKRVSKKRPTAPLPGTMLVKITLEIPDEAFMPLEPKATIVVPLEHTEVTVHTEPLEVLSSEE